MKEKVKASVVQFTPEWLQTEKNVERMGDIAEKEAKKGVELIVFPELANTGYITPAEPGLPASFDSKMSAQEFASKYIEASELVPGPTSDRLTEVTRKHGVYIVVGISRLHPVISHTIYNSAALVGPSGVIGIYDKIHVAAMEKLLFYPGDRIEVYKTDLGNIGISICYDGRFPELPRILTLKGAEIICSILNVPRGWSISDPHWVRYRASTRAAENCNYYLVSSRGGREGEAIFVGHSVIAAPNGEIVAATDSEEEDIVTAELYDEEIIKVRSQYLSFADRRPDLYYPIAEPLSKPFHATPALAFKPAADEVAEKTASSSP